MIEKQIIAHEGCNAYNVLKRLKTADLIIHTIPGEEWTLSCHRHKQLLVDVYTLTGVIAGTKKAQCYQSGLLSEVLIRLLRKGRRVGYLRHEASTEPNITDLGSKRHTKDSETLEEAMILNLKSGDIFFECIPSERWRLTSTSFGKTTDHIPFFHLAEMSTPNIRMFKDSNLSNILLQFLCKDSTFRERSEPTKILFFKAINMPTV